MQHVQHELTCVVPRPRTVELCLQYPVALVIELVEFEPAYFVARPYPVLVCLPLEVVLVMEPVEHELD